MMKKETKTWYICSVCGKKVEEFDGGPKTQGPAMGTWILDIGGEFISEYFDKFTGYTSYSKHIIDHNHRCSSREYVCSKECFCKSLERRVDAFFGIPIEVKLKDAE